MHVTCLNKTDKRLYLYAGGIQIKNTSGSFDCSTIKDFKSIKRTTEINSVQEILCICFLEADATLLVSVLVPPMK